MFDRLREITAAGLGILAQRLTVDPRRPGWSRIPQTVQTVAGVSITADNAVTIATVWACLRYLSQTVAVLPWHAMKDGKNGAEIAYSHNVDYLLSKRVSDEWSSFQFRETLTHWALRWGNGYAEIERDNLGRPFALWPIHPERVTVCRDPDTQELYYRVGNGYEGTNGSVPVVEIAAKDMFHLRGFGEGVVGVNMVHYASQSLGWARATQLFGAAFFGNGMNVAGVVVNKKPLKPDGLKRQKAEFENLYKGPVRAGKTAFLDNDADWKAIGVSPEQAQLILTQQFQVEEICRWFGVPPSKVQHLLRATFTNVESQGIEVVVDTVTPWVKRFEDEADWKLFGRQNRMGFYSKMNMRALMRGDATSRSAYYQAMVRIGAYSPNRVLELEDENTIGPDGDIHVMQSQNVTLEQIADGTAGNVAGAPGTKPAPDPDQDEPSPSTDDNPSQDDPAIGSELDELDRIMGTTLVE